MRHKPIGGVESCALYPADAVESLLFSSEGSEVSLVGNPVEVELAEDRSTYEEVMESRHGVVKVTHRLTLVAHKDAAAAWLTENFTEEGTYNGFVAVVRLSDGRNLLVGHSLALSNEQPLLLETLTSHSGTSPHDTPTVTLLLVSQDTEFSQEIV